MNLITLTALSWGMSMDAFAASLTRGVAYKEGKNRSILLIYALKTGLIFGLIESIAPVIGYFIGTFAKNVVQNYDHWVSFILLSCLGVHTIHEALKQNKQGQVIEKNSLFKTVLTAIATSIDALIVGVSLAFLEVNIWLAAGLIGCCTAVMVSLGVGLGVKLGEKWGKKAEILGGGVLILVGILILISHLIHH